MNDDDECAPRACFVEERLTDDFDAESWHDATHARVYIAYPLLSGWWVLLVVSVAFALWWPQGTLVCSHLHPSQLDPVR